MTTILTTRTCWNMTSRRENGTRLGPCQSSGASMPLLSSITIPLRNTAIDVISYKLKKKKSFLFQMTGAQCPLSQSGLRQLDILSSYRYLVICNRFCLRFHEIRSRRIRIMHNNIMIMLSANCSSFAAKLIDVRLLLVVLKAMMQMLPPQSQAQNTEWCQQHGCN